MNVANVFTSRVPSRPDPVRTDARIDSRSDEAEEGTEPPQVRKTTRAEFSALLALLADAGPRVRGELLTQLPKDGGSLIDKLLEGELGSAALVDPDTSASSLMTTSDSANTERATDALRYGILNEHRAGTGPASTIASPMAGLPGTERAADMVVEHSHAREVLSRIVARNSATADQLKALGDTEAADVRVALDALLSRAGTPAGLELASAAENASLAASAAALANATTRSAADVNTPVRDTDALAPELRQRLGRVIDRMKNEYGHDVSVVETARSQERQDFLFEQGRSRPGAVVTWTRDSAHTQGEAVDVIIDGKWNNAEGFARLQRIAKEEGLRTLGVRDPGHLELAASNRLGANGATQAMPDQTKTATPLVAPAAQSGVAQVASVAGAAGVARIAEPGSGGARSYSSLSEGVTKSVVDASPTAIASATLPDNARGQGNAFGRGERDDQGRPANDGRKTGAVRRDTTGATDGSAFAAPTAASAAGGTHSAAATTPVPAGAASAERVMDIQQMREDTPAGSVSRMTLNIDAPDGAKDRITIDVRGNSVGTQINTDVANAERLRMRTADLQDALGRHGLESDTVRIAGVRSEPADARLALNERDTIRLGAAQQSHQSDSGMNQGQRERAATARDWERQDTSRQARDEQERERQNDARQNANQRGRRETPHGSYT